MLSMRESAAGEVLVHGWVLPVPQKAHLPHFMKTRAARRLGKRKEPSGFHVAVLSQPVNQPARSLKGKTAP